jgi:hypothetical protein
MAAVEKWGAEDQLSRQPTRPELIGDGVNGSVVPRFNGGIEVVDFSSPSRRTAGRMRRRPAHGRDSKGASIPSTHRDIERAARARMLELKPQLEPEATDAAPRLSRRRKASWSSWTSSCSCSTPTDGRQPPVAIRTPEPQERLALPALAGRWLQHRRDPPRPWRVLTARRSSTSRGPEYLKWHRDESCVKAHGNDATNVPANRFLVSHGAARREVPSGREAERRIPREGCRDRVPRCPRTPGWPGCARHRPSGCGTHRPWLSCTFRRRDATSVRRVARPRHRAPCDSCLTSPLIPTSSIDALASPGVRGSANYAQRLHNLGSWVGWGSLGDSARRARGCASLHSHAVRGASGCYRSATRASSSRRGSSLERLAAARTQVHKSST